MLYSTRKLNVISDGPFWANPFFLDGQWYWHIDQRFLAWLARILTNAVTAGRTSSDAIPESEAHSRLTRLDPIYWPTVDRDKAIAADAIFAEFSPEQLAEAFQTARDPVLLEPIPAHYFNPYSWDWLGLKFKLSDDVSPWPEFHEDKKRWWSESPETSHPPRVSSDPASGPGPEEKRKRSVSGPALFDPGEDVSATKE